jgi:hypothetical protein
VPVNLFVPPQHWPDTEPALADDTYAFESTLMRHSQENHEGDNMRRPSAETLPPKREKIAKHLNGDSYEHKRNLNQGTSPKEINPYPSKAKIPTDPQGALKLPGSVLSPGEARVAKLNKDTRRMLAYLNSTVTIPM